MIRWLLVIIVVILGLAVVLPFMLRTTAGGVFEPVPLVGQYGSIIRGSLLGVSFDAGTTWKKSNVSESKTVAFPYYIYGVAFHPNNPDTLFLGTHGSGLWQSANGGASWRPVTDSAGVLKRASDVYRVSISRTNPLVMYAAVYQDTRGMVMRTDDGGNTFHIVYTIPANRYGVFDLAVDSFDENHVMAVTGQGALIDSRNGGGTWQVKKWFGESLSELLVDPRDANRMIVITSGGNVFRSEDGGVEWADLKSAIAGIVTQNSLGINAPPYAAGGLALNPWNTIRTLTVDPNNFNRMYLGTYQGLFWSDDSGVSWERISLLTPAQALPVDAIAIRFGDPRAIFLGVSNQLHTTFDGGASWGFRVISQKYKIKKLYAHPLRSETMFAILGT